MTVQRIIDAYLAGDFLLSEFVDMLGRVVVGEDAAEFLLSLPEDVRQELLDFIRRYPHTEEGWARVRHFALGMYGPDAAASQPKDAERLQVQVFRRAVEWLRAGVLRIG